MRSEFLAEREQNNIGPCGKCRYGTTTATLADESVHLGLLDSKNTVTSGWTPVYTRESSTSVVFKAQVNPFVELTAEIGVNFLSGTLDLSTGVTAIPELINAFNINITYDISNSANVTLLASTDATCVNGMWYSSAFEFIVTGFATQFHSLELYRLDVPIYESGC